MERVFHVLHLTLSLEVGGAERVICSLVTGQDSVAMKQSVCCLDSIGSLGEGLIEKGYSVVCLKRKPGVDWGLIFKLRDFCSRHGVDLIHAHGESPWFYSALAAALPFFRFLPCITTIHGYGGGDRQSLESYRLWRFLTFLSRKVVLVSPALQRELLQVGFSRSKLRTIVNGLVVDDLSENAVRGEIREELGLDDDLYVIGIVARLSPVKNHALLLRAVAKLQTLTDRSFRLVIVGDGPERDRLEELAGELGIRKLVVFCGEQSDVSCYYSVFDLFVLPSFSEGISMTVLEAMAAGVPVAASAVGGNRDIIEQGYNGILFPSDNVEALVAALMDVLEQPERARMLAERGRATVCERFSLAAMLRAYREIYCEIMGQNLPEKTE